MKIGDDLCRTTPYGFEWAGVTVERVACSDGTDHKKRHAFLRILHPNGDAIHVTAIREGFIANRILARPFNAEEVTG